jgi:predicted Rossmann-fold nucleotide-binding protein
MAGSARVDVADVPVEVYRTALYRPVDLFDTRPYADTLDARAYAWFREPPTPRATLAQALHDHAIDEALTTWIKDRHLVGVMGAHEVRRDSPAYADAARLGHALAPRHVVTTGGGPGAMEAANLGAFLAGDGLDRIEEAITGLSEVASYAPSVDAWAARALELVDGVRGRDNLGIPTWSYGHEPPNVFATAIAKYFRNATREAILLQVCDAGIVFLPGAGGTVQEIFQDGCENYYADPASVAPMVLVGRAYWTEELPAWPLLQSLARGRPMEEHIHLVDTVDEAAAVVNHR